ncbi:MAG TPA: glycerate kinase [Candidatus Blautia excrementipullorum]|nr:glycerate kinase [Candidatus Blautia excrementipullorum]
MKVFIATDSFKGSLSSIQAAKRMEEGILRVFPEAVIEYSPIADGGEGTVETLVTALGGEIKHKKVMKPNGGYTEAKFGILNNGKAVIEMAAACGLPLVDPEERSIMDATTYGAGELLKAALDAGCRQILIGIGGSATNDGGVGMAQALGASFKDRSGNEIGFGGKALADISDIDLTGLDYRLKDTEITVMCDVTNPLYGENGAARIYGPQKGATEEQIKELDKGLKNLADVTEKVIGKDFRWIKGAGAAGGLGMGMKAFLNANLKPGIEAIMDASNIDEKIKKADIVVTGEGRIDNQSVCGKVIDGIAKRAHVYNKPVIAVVGSAESNISEVYAVGIKSVEAAVCRNMTVSYAMNEASTLVADAAERIMRSISVGMELHVAEAEEE